MSLKFIKKMYAIVFGLFLLSSPVFVLAQNPAPKVGNSSGTIFGITYQCSPKPAVDAKGNAIKDASGKQIMLYGECNFDDLVEATLYVVNWGTRFALAFSVVVIAFAGYRYMISGDNPGERKKANSMMTKVVIGIIFILLAWVIVRIIGTALGVSTGVSNLL